MRDEVRARRIAIAVAILAMVFAVPLFAADPPKMPDPPDYGETYIAGIYPSGGQRGTTVVAQFRGFEGVKGRTLHSLAGAKSIVIDGEPGITVGKIKNVSDLVVEAELIIAADAVPGRRMLRVASERSGLTNFSYFYVGTLPEVVEKERNDNEKRAQAVTMPVVVNGRVAAALDVDCYRFAAKKGRKIVCAVAAHSLDSRNHNPRSFTDAALEVVDAEGRVVADAADTLGLDPAVEFVAPADGDYFAKVRLVNFIGYPDAVYRLTIGDVPYPTVAFPVAVEAGKTAEVAVSGMNVRADAKVRVTADAEPALPIVRPVAPGAEAADLTVLVTETPESIESEPNDELKSAKEFAAPIGISGRFDRQGDVDYYRLKLEPKKKYRCEITAQRYLRSPVDTHVEVFGADGTSLQANDDLASSDVEQLHDFDSFDSATVITGPADGVCYVAVREQTGSFGPRAVYHLSIDAVDPTPVLHVWPDSVAVWGPGSTAGFCVTVDRRSFNPNDFELSIEGLPAGWIGSTSLASVAAPSKRVLMTITAPKDAKPGDVAPFRVVARPVDPKTGKAKPEYADTVYRVQPLTALLSTDRQYCRVSPQIRAGVGRDIGLRLAATTSSLKVAKGQDATLDVRVDPADFAELRYSVNIGGAGFRCNLGVPQNAPVKNGTATVRIPCANLPVGKHPIVVSLAWDSEFRKGMPGPCTSIVILEIVESSTVAGK
jgi:hypothetical protein